MADAKNNLDTPCNPAPSGYHTVARMDRDCDGSMPQSTPPPSDHQGISVPTSPSLPEPAVYSPARAAAYLDLVWLGVKNPEASLDRAAKNGDLPSITVFGRRAYRREDLDRYIDTLQKRQEEKARARSGRR